METLQIIAGVLLVLFAVGLIVIIVQARNAHQSTSKILELLKAQIDAKSLDKEWKDAVEAALSGLVSTEARTALNNLISLIQAVTPTDVDSFLESVRKLFNEITDGLPNNPPPSEDKLREMVIAAVRSEAARNVQVADGTTTTVTTTVSTDPGKVG